MSKTMKLILTKLPTFLLASAPFALYKIGCFIIAGEPKVPEHLHKKD